MNKRHWRIFSALPLALAAGFIIPAAIGQQEWKPSTDWAHWRLGHRTELDWLQKNRLTVTFGSGAPNFEQGTRAQFDAGLEKAKAANRDFHNKGYIVLRYLTSSLGGSSGADGSDPTKEQVGLIKFWQEQWGQYEDYIGARPAEDPKTWITVRPDGTFPFYRYAVYGKKPGRNFETWGCPNNPDYIRMMEGRIRSQAETGIDGSYIDWTQISGGTCYCKYCRANFISYLKKNLPPEVSKAKYDTADYANIRLPQKRGEPFWMEWITFRGRAVADLHSHLREVARKYNPNFLISGNVFGGFGYGPIAYDAAGNMEMLGKEEGFIYSEMQEYLDASPRKNDQGVKITNSPALKFLAAATHGKPTVIYATEITPPIFPHPDEKCLSAMAQINIAEAEANHAIFREKRETPPGATALYNFLADNEDRLATAQLHSNVGILASLNQYLADELSFAFSTSRVFADKGIAHAMLVEDDLVGGDLGKFDLIVVPYLPLLSQEKQKALVRYVENGGALLVLGASGAKTEHNVVQKDVPLASLFGKAAYPSQAISRKRGRGVARFMPLPIPQSKYLIPIKKDNREFSTTYGPSMEDIFADIPEGYTRNRIDPALRKILEQLAAQVPQMTGGRVTQLQTPSPFVEVTTMLTRDAGRMIVHLVNYNVTVDGDITPAKGLKVDIAPPRGKQVKSVEYSGTLAKLRPAPFKAGKGGVVTFDADALDIYGMAVVELR
jgi:hypothetical protein